MEHNLRYIVFFENFFLPLNAFHVKMVFPLGLAYWSFKFQWTRPINVRYSITSMKKLIAILCAATTLSVAPAIASASTANAMNTTDGTNIAAAPAAYQTEVNTNGAITAPPNFSFDVATQLAAPPNEIAFTDIRVCPADGRTEATLALVKNYVPASPDVGKASINGTIGNFSDYTGYTIGATAKDSGGGVNNGTVIVTG